MHSKYIFSLRFIVFDPFFHSLSRLRFLCTQKERTKTNKRNNFFDDAFQCSKNGNFYRSFHWYFTIKN
nr:MAG TPA: hypothetical protein [Caudoviricetes sp.]